MMRFQRGFTLVELVLVIVVLGILTSIGAVVWTGVEANARDKARETDARQWASTFDTYKGRNLVWPLLPSGDGAAGVKAVCLGTPVSPTPNSTKCVQYSGGASTYLDTSSNSDYTAMMTAVATVGKTPVNSGSVVSNSVAGPFVYLWQSTNTTTQTVTITGLFMNFFEHNCPSDFLKPSDIATKYPSSDTHVYDQLTTLLGGVSGANACGLVKQFSYNPNSLL